MPAVNFPDGTRVNFPDEMDSDAIHAASAKLWTEQLSPEAKGGAKPEQAPQRELETIKPAPLIPTSREELKRYGHDIRGMYQGAIEDPLLGTAQLAAHGGEALTGVSSPREYIDQLIAARERSYQAGRREAGEADLPDVNRIAGGVISPVYAAAGAALRPAQGAGVLARLASAGGTGAAIGAMQPVTDTGDYVSAKGIQALTGAGAGASGEAVASTVAPWVTANAQRLAERYGIRVPPLTSTGQVGRRVEEISQSVPLSGMAVRGAYDTANKDLVRAANNEVSRELEPHGYGFPADKKTPVDRQIAVRRGYQIEASYNNVIPRMQGTMDPQFTSAIAAERAALEPGIRPRFDHYIDRNLISHSQGGRLDGQLIKNADRDLRLDGTELVQSPSSPSSDKQLGRALLNVRGELRNMWDRHSAPSDVAQLEATDRAWGLHKIIERAETSSAAPEGVFGPTQLWQAVKAGDNTLGKRALSQGRARLQDLAETAKTTMGKTVADSGTPERAGLILATKTALGLGATAHTGVAPMLGAIGAHAAAYSPPGQAMMRALVGGAANPRELASSAVRHSISPGVAALATSMRPYDNTPKTKAEWDAEHAKRQQAGAAAQQYYGPGQ